jgi:hypothetical protein
MRPTARKPSRNDADPINTSIINWS